MAVLGISPRPLRGLIRSYMVTRATLPPLAAALPSRQNYIIISRFICQALFSKKIKKVFSKKGLTNPDPYGIIYTDEGKHKKIRTYGEPAYLF